MIGELPGGLWERGARRRTFALRPVTGRLELAIAETVETAASLPAAVTGALTVAVDHIDGRPVTSARAAALCVADRQYLLVQLLIHLGRGQSWRHGLCSSCAAPFDFHLDLAVLPVNPAPDGYPFASLRVPGGTMRFRLPTGADQEALAFQGPGTTMGDGDDDADDGASDVWALLRRCWIAPKAPGHGPERQAARAERWDRLQAQGDEALARVEAALDAVAPGLPTSVQTACPECGAHNDVPIDLHEALAGRVDGLLREVDQLAARYHWGETEILGMPRPRRQRYLHLVDEARGLSS